MGGRESLAQSFTLLSFISAGLIAVSRFFTPGLTDNDSSVMFASDSIPQERTGGDRPQQRLPRPETVVHSSTGETPTESNLLLSLLGQPDRPKSSQAQERDRPERVLTSTTSFQAVADIAKVLSASHSQDELVQGEPEPDQSITEVAELSTSELSTSELSTSSVARSVFQPVPQPHVPQQRTEVAVFGESRYLNSQVIVDLSDRQVSLYENGQHRVSFPIAIGRAGWETPVGEYEVLSKEVNPVWQNPLTEEVVAAGPENPLGSRWIGFWSDGKNQLGFHGTNQSELIGQAVSHGCIRMHNDDIERLYERVAVGTTVKIQP